MYRFVLLFLGFLFSFCATAQEIQTYKGSYPRLHSTLHMVKPTATYQYYEDEDFSRIYHGDFNMKFHGKGSTEKVIRWGSVKGQFKNGKHDGDWEVNYPYVETWIGQNKIEPLNLIITFSFVDGKLDGKWEAKVIDQNKKIRAQYIKNYKKGECDGEFIFDNPLPGNDFKEIHGEYKDGKPIGKWKFIFKNDDRGVIEYENGSEKANYKIDQLTGKRINYGVRFYGVDFGGVGLEGFHNYVIKNIGQSTK